MHKSDSQLVPAWVDPCKKGAFLRLRTKYAGRERLAQLGVKPAALGVDEASAFCGMSAGQFLKEVAAGTLPAPIAGLLSKRKLWSLRALERAINGRDGAAPAPDNDPVMNLIKSHASRVA
jgi:hypothetical protein